MIESFEKAYPSTVRHNKKIMTIHRIQELEAREELNLAERTELERLRRKVKKL